MTPEMRLHPLQKLVLKWRAIGLLITAFARLIRRYEDGHRQGAREPAAQLELAARAAHAMLMQDICEALEAAPPETPEQDHALAHLRCIAFALLAIAFVIENILENGLRRAAFWAGEWLAQPGAREGSKPRRLGDANAILDPG